MEVVVINTSEIEMIEIVTSANNNDKEEIEKEKEYQLSPDESVGNGETIKPGSKIKPETTIEDAERLAERLYGISTSDITELISYDDRNYLIHEDRNIKNPLIVNNWPHGYILKIVNALDSQKLQLIEAQTDILLFLRNHDITCPNPIQNVYGKYYSMENINGSNHAIRLLEFLPGKIFHEISKTNHLFYQVGEYVGKLDMALKKFNHDAYKDHKSVWMLESIPKLKDFLYILKDHGQKEIVEQVIDAFEKKVVPKIDSFEKQIIHGDFNEQNILVNKIKNDRDEYKICGILDFGDTSYSPLVFELAITMTYMILDSKDLKIGGLIIAGYSSIRMLHENELKVLKECVAGRLCQSLVLGAYTHSLYPENDYVLVNQKPGWELLELLWKEKFNDIDEIWAQTADNYLKQSLK